MSPFGTAREWLFSTNSTFCYCTGETVENILDIGWPLQATTVQSHKQTKHLTWNKNSHLLRFVRALISALIHPRVLPAHVRKGHNVIVAVAMEDLVVLNVLNLVDWQVRHVVTLQFPGGGPCGRAGDGERRAFGQHESFVVGRDLQAAHFGAETQQSCSWDNKRKKKTKKRSGWRSKRKQHEVGG